MRGMERWVVVALSGEVGDADDDYQDLCRYVFFCALQCTHSLLRDA